MIEIRWHGRGGQGAVTSVEMLAMAAIEAGKYAQGFPAFGPERRGAPGHGLQSNIRKNLSRSAPASIALMSSLCWTPVWLGLVNVTDGLKPDGILIVNTTKSAEEIRKALNFKGNLFTVDATHIARQELGVPITNTTMLGAVLKATGVLALKDSQRPAGREVRTTGDQEREGPQAGL